MTKIECVIIELHDSDNIIFINTEVFNSNTVLSPFSEYKHSFKICPYIFSNENYTAMFLMASSHYDNDVHWK